jgi:Flp pilus assembly protein TadG
MALIERVRRARRRQRGQAVVELAIIAPIMIILLLAVADLGRVFHSEVTIENAARAGALEAAKNPTSYQDGLPCDATTNRVVCAVLRESSSSFLSLTPADIDLVCDPDPCAEALGNTVTVTVRSTFSLITPLLSAFMGGQSFPLESTSAAQISVVPTVPGSSPSPSPTPTPSPSPSPAPSSSPGPSPSPTPTPSPSPDPSPSPSPNPCIAPVADFSISPTSGKKKKTTFQFTDLSTTSTDCPLTWSWNFGDGGGASSTSTLQNPSHVYDSQGTYTVTLVVSNLGGSHTKTRTVTVTP